MKKIVYLTLLVGLIMSCKEKNNGKEKVNNIQISDSLNTSDKPQQEVKEVVVKKTTYNEAQKLYDLKSDTVYVTNYWATWCGPCVHEIPDFLALQKEYGDKKVKMYFINVDGTATEEEIEPFVKENKMKNVYHISPQELVENIGKINPELAQGIPVTIIQKGNKVEGFIGSQPKEFIDMKINEYLKK